MSEDPDGILAEADVTPVSVPDASANDANEYSYVVNKFSRPVGQTAWGHQAVTDYLSGDEAVDWIEAGGPRA